MTHSTTDRTAFEPCGVISITTDFGHKGPFIGTMKGMILMRFPAARIIDLTHETPIRIRTRDHELALAGNVVRMVDRQHRRIARHQAKHRRPSQRAILIKNPRRPFDIAPRIE